MPGATNAVQELARLTAEGASLLDECMKYNMIRESAPNNAPLGLLMIILHRTCCEIGRIEGFAQPH